MSVNITTEPVEVSIDGTVFFLQGDPTNSKEWDVLLETEVFYTGKKQAPSHQALVDALVAVAETPQDAETVKSLTVGTRTLKRVADGYVLEVTGFPTQPRKPSTTRSKGTGAR